MKNRMRIKIGGVPEHFNLPWRLAMQQGDFEKENIALHWEDMGGGTGQMIKGLQNKTIDVAVLLTEGISRAILQGLDAKILQVYVKSPLRWGIHVPFADQSIQKVEDLKGKTFAISREGSGSHLMSYVLADQKGWDIDNLKFNSVGDVYGGLWALENDEAQAFLWEKYTTHPYTEQEKCRYIDEVVTPWPCFVVAVRGEVAEQYEEELQTMLSVVNKKAESVKYDEKTPEVLSWRYGLKLDDVTSWLNETEWNYKAEKFDKDFDNVIKYLLKLKLITEREAENYMEKLF
ncbi:ABC transporter substrate-binding protein [Brumimicrobium salinarum]|uniref:ABC transporter substrate-binding protein n=1 Tax=Brumimicrobium salinarum TaxID=2058658 RepID=A0A2I0R188_9FLAO|nr:substrate-binding domain-containing protein [Brumimicrobium salinarum]PKR80344.1 ABC transporter substrate-binding protein [Brumimicrobium salinarum]